ncbi:DNA polymerase III subunit delta [Pseudoglutamicibacter albus]|uniref:DNA polymerase III subunit delta n=1 Tax=Pseudoglutamicibacter albus TaxID=98671 RepID=UPI0036080F41
MTPPARSKRATRSAGGQRGPNFRSAEPAPLVFLDGADDYQAARAFEVVRSKARAADPSIEVTRIDGESYEPSQLILASSPSLFGGSPLIEIHGLEKMNEALQKDLLSYIEAPQEDAVLVLHHSGGQRGKTLVNVLKKRASVIDVSPLKKDQERQDFVLGSSRVCAVRWILKR